MRPRDVRPRPGSRFPAAASRILVLFALTVATRAGATDAPRRPLSATELALLACTLRNGSADACVTSAQELKEGTLVQAALSETEPGRHDAKPSPIVRQFADWKRASRSERNEIRRARIDEQAVPALRASLAAWLGSLSGPVVFAYRVPIGAYDFDEQGFRVQFGNVLGEGAQPIGLDEDKLLLWGDASARLAWPTPYGTYVLPMPEASARAWRKRAADPEGRMEVRVEFTAAPEDDLPRFQVGRVTASGAGSGGELRPVDWLSPPEDESRDDALRRLFPPLPCDALGPPRQRLGPLAWGPKRDPALRTLVEGSAAVSEQEVDLLVEVLQRGWRPEHLPACLGDAACAAMPKDDEFAARAGRLRVQKIVAGLVCPRDVVVTTEHRLGGYDREAGAFRLWAVGETRPDDVRLDRAWAARGLTWELQLDERAAERLLDQVKDRPVQRHVVIVPQPTRIPDDQASPHGRVPAVVKAVVYSFQGRVLAATRVDGAP